MPLQHLHVASSCLTSHNEGNRLSVEAVAVETGPSLDTCAFYLCRATYADVVGGTVYSASTG